MGYAEKSIPEIVREQFSYGDVFTMKRKDGQVNIGGVLAIRNDKELFQRCQSMVVLLEGFPPTGDWSIWRPAWPEGSGTGDYLTSVSRVSLRYLLQDAGVPVQSFIGGHAVFVDVGRIYLRCKIQYPAHAFAVACMWKVVFVQ